MSHGTRTTHISVSVAEVTGLVAKYIFERFGIEVSTADILPSISGNGQEDPIELDGFCWTVHEDLLENAPAKAVKIRKR